MNPPTVLVNLFVTMLITVFAGMALGFGANEYAHVQNDTPAQEQLGKPLPMGDSHLATLEWGKPFFIRMLDKNRKLSINHCSTGYFGKRAGQIYMITAAHCIEKSIDNKVYVKDPTDDKKFVIIGNIDYGVDDETVGDVAMIKIKPTSSEKSFPDAPINGPELGDAICLTGVTSGLRCTKNINDPQDLPADNPNKPFTWIRLPSDFGDSGGTAYIEHNGVKRPYAELGRMTIRGDSDPYGQDQFSGFTTVHKMFDMTGITPIMNQSVIVETHK